MAHAHEALVVVVAVARRARLASLASICAMTGNVIGIGHLIGATVS